MMRNIILLLVAISSVVNAEGFHYPDHEFDRTRLGNIVDRASVKILKEAYAMSSDKNVIVSPLGVLILLSLYSSGTAEGARNEIIQALGASNYADLVESYTGLSERFASLDADFLTLANKVYVSNKYTLAELFSNTATSYHSEVDKIDFSNPENAAAIISQWGEQKTKGHIKNAVSKDLIDPKTAAALCNVIFLQGHWNIPFNETDTKEKDFHVDKTTTVKKPTMNLIHTLFYHENAGLGAKLVELPYKEKGFRMVVVLPNEIDGLPLVLEKVAQGGILADVFSLSPAGKFNLELPKFDIESGFDLKQLLPKVGVSKIFHESAPQIINERPVVVSAAIQKAFVKVNEEGATAGAFTGVFAVPESSPYVPPPPIDFKVDHPFLFFILHEDIVLFAGTYTQ